jgi:hypothetical protein
LTKFSGAATGAAVYALSSDVLSTLVSEPLQARRWSKPSGKPGRSE